jgi:hypothetical protein
MDEKTREAYNLIIRKLEERRLEQDASAREKALLKTSLKNLRKIEREC